MVAYCGAQDTLWSDLVAPELIGGTMPVILYECRQTACQTYRYMVVNLQIDHVSTTV